MATGREVMRGFRRSSAEETDVGHGIALARKWAAGSRRCSGASAGAKKLLAYAALSAGAFNITAGNRLTISPTASGFFDMA
jgi:hypothetical protein